MWPVFPTSFIVQHHLPVCRQLHTDSPAHYTPSSVEWGRNKVELRWRIEPGPSERQLNALTTALFRPGKEQTNHPISSKSHPPATANKAIHYLKWGIGVTKPTGKDLNKTIKQHLQIFMYYHHAGLYTPSFLTHSLKFGNLCRSDKACVDLTQICMLLVQPGPVHSKILI